MNPAQWNFREWTVWAACLVLCCGLQAAQPTIELQRTDKDAAPAFVLKGIPGKVLARWRQNALAEETWHQLFGVRAVYDGRPASVAMLGDYVVDGDKVRFTPRYPLRAGMTYQASFDPTAVQDAELADGQGRVTTFSIPAPGPSAPTRLTAIYPTGDLLPENLLKFYLHFSAPMSRGEAYRRIRLLDEQGKKIEYPFLELAEELWSPDGQRFTLYFDPGRIKRGLKPREEFGPALMEGGEYSLVIDAAWPDAKNQPLQSGVVKKFRVVAPDEEQPNPQQWEVRSPPADSRRPLQVRFDEPLDAAMLQRVLQVRNSQQERVAGTIKLGEQERSWSFEPDRPWAAGEYRLVIATVLEDRSGNSIGRPFEVDVFRPANPQVEAATIERPFTVSE